MTIEEIRKNKPDGATHYMKSFLRLGDSDTITYFKCEGGKYFEYFSHHFAKYETGVCKDLIKPL